MGTFGDLLWISTRGSQGLANAARSVREALDAAGINYDRKKFMPHITMVRRMTGNWRQVPAPKCEMIVKKISLMKTTFKDGKPVYSEINI
jgi:2'-5' RNA ligase